MKKIEKFLFGLGMPHAGLEKYTTVERQNNLIIYGKRVYLSYDREPTLRTTSEELYNPGDIRKALIFLNKYSEQFDFKVAERTLNDLIKYGFIESMKLTTSKMTVNGSTLLHWSKMSPTEVGMLLGLSRRRKFIATKTIDGVDIYYFKEVDINGTKRYIGSLEEMMNSYRGLYFRGEYGLERRGNYTVIWGEYDTFLLGPYIKTSIESELIGNAIDEVESMNGSWVLRDYDFYTERYCRRAGPFTVEKTVTTEGITYIVKSSSGENLYITENEKFGEKLNFRRIKKILT